MFKTENRSEQKLNENCKEKGRAVEINIFGKTEVIKIIIQEQNLNTH